MTPVLPLLLLLGLLAGCGSAGPAREDVYYRLDLSRSPAAVAERWPATLLMAKLDGRGFAGDRAIVFRDPSKQDQVQRYTYHLWAEAPPLTVQDLLARYLRQARVAAHIVTPAQRVNADLVISGTLFRFEHRPFSSPPSVRIELELAVVRSDRRELVFLKRYESTIETASEQIAAAVPAFNQGLEQVFTEFTGDLEAALKTVEQRPPPRAPRSRDRRTERQRR